MFFYYTLFSSAARGVPYLLHGNYDPSTQLTLGAKATNNQKSRWRHPEEKEKGIKETEGWGKRVTTYGGWGMADATQPKKVKGSLHGPASIERRFGDERKGEITVVRTAHVCGRTDRT